MAANEGQHAQANDETFYLVMVVLVPILFCLVWHFAGRYVYAWERIGLYGILSLWGLIPTDIYFLGWFTRKFLYYRYTPASEIEFRADVIPDSLVVNGVLLLVIVFMVIKRVIYIGKAHPYSIYARKLNIYDYIFQQMPMYPHLRLMWKLRLLARPLNTGLFRMADSPKVLVLRNRLMMLETLHSEPVLDEPKARRLFDAQLKRMLPLPTNDPVADAKACIAVLTNNEKAVLAAVVCRLAVCDANVSDEEFKKALALSDQLVTQYWVGYDPYKPELPDEKRDAENPDMPLVPPPPPVDTSGCDEILMRYLVYPRVRESMLAHAYVRTFIYDALQACRKVGKFTPARFRWLRMMDREFWLLVSSAGRSVAFWEAAGVHAHYLWERKAKKPVEKPQTGECVTALDDEFVDRTIFSKEQRAQLWEMQGKKGANVPKAIAKQGANKRPVTGRPQRS